MNQERRMVLETLESMFKERLDSQVCDRAEAGQWPVEIWQALDEAGITTASIPETLGGSGLNFADALAMNSVVGRCAAPMPLAEHLLAVRILAEQSVPLPEGPVSITFADDSIKVQRERLSGKLTDVPWGYVASAVLVFVSSGDVQLIKPKDAVITRGANLAGEPRDELACYDVVCQQIDPGAWLQPQVFAHLALSRALAMSGAIESVLELSLDYVTTRKQFGKNIAGFQAVQHLLAQMAGEVAAAKRSADAALEAVASDGLLTEVAVAKARIGEAAGIVAAIAHQVHGAMGFTHEHRLHQVTRRLWAWRDEYGNEAYWQQALGRTACRAGADRAFSFLTEGHRGITLS